VVATDPRCIDQPPCVLHNSSSEYHSGVGLSRTELMRLLKTPFHFHALHASERSEEFEPKTSDVLFAGELMHCALLERANRCAMRSARVNTRGRRVEGIRGFARCRGGAAFVAREASSRAQSADPEPAADQTRADLAASAKIAFAQSGARSRARSHRCSTHRVLAEHVATGAARTRKRVLRPGLLVGGGEASMVLLDAKTTERGA
jgi:hypothetical protein